MTKEQFKKWYSNIFGTYENRRNYWIKHKEELKKMEYAPMRKEIDIPILTDTFGDCEAAARQWQNQYYVPDATEEGNNPMCFKASTPQTIAGSNASLVINAEKSDEMTQREYLLSQLRDSTRYAWQDPKYVQLRKLFNIDAPEYPRTSQELLDAFKNGKYTVDQAKVDKNAKYVAYRQSDDSDSFDEDYEDGMGDRFFGITFTDLPKADRKGFDAAVKAYEAEKKMTERKIMIGSPAAGLDALVALETWTPTGAAN